MLKYNLIKIKNNDVNRNCFSYRYFKTEIKKICLSTYIFDETIDEWYTIFINKKYLTASDFYINEIDNGTGDPNFW